MDALVRANDAGLVDRLEDACRERDHPVTRLASLPDLARVFRAGTPTLSSSTLRWPLAAASVATTVAAVHCDLAIALAVAKRIARSGGFRTIDRRWPGERMLEELELAYIGIPASSASGHQ